MTGKKPGRKRSSRKSGSGFGPGPAPPTLPVRPADALFDFEAGEYVAENLVYDGVRIDGGMSVVLRVVHQVDKRPRACKILRPELAGDPEAAASAIQEFSRAKKVTGKHAVTLYDLGAMGVEHGGRTVKLPLFTMEWVDGESLADILRRHPEGLPAEEAFGLAIQLAEGVASLHRAGVLHLDLKPSNIMVDSEGVLKLIDFGVGLDLRRRHDEVAAGRWLTSAYAPWELLEGRFERLGTASDVYQAGVILYELFAGAPTKNVSYAALSERIEFVPAELDELILRCLTEDPRARPRDGAQLLGSVQATFDVFKANRKAGRRRASTKPRELWEKLQLVARGEPRIWEYQAALARDLLEELGTGGGGGFLGLGSRIEADEVRKLLEEAEVELRKRRENRFQRLLDRRDWDGAAEMLEELAGQVPDAEAESYRRALDLERSLHGHKASAAVRAARRRALEVLSDAGAPPWMRQRLGARLQKLMEDLPSPSPRPDVPAPVIAAPPSLWTCATGGGETRTVAVPGAVLRLGRGSWLDAGAENHADLRPTPPEAEADPKLERLCLQISHRHLEISVTGTVVEALCPGRFGAEIDGRPVARGQSATLADAGEISLALGASRWRYEVHRSTDGRPAAVVLEGVGNVGCGRRVVLVVAPVRCGLVLAEADDVPLTLHPSAGTWHCEPHAAGFALGGRPLAPGRPVPWLESVRLTAPGDLSIFWTGAGATASRPPAAADPGEARD